jgi:hypothetical protein
MRVAFNFDGASQTVTEIDGTLGKFKRETGVALDTFYVLVDETSNITAGYIEIVTSSEVDGVTYTATQPLFNSSDVTKTTQGVYPFIVALDADYTVRTSGDFAGTAVGYISDANNYGKDVGVA